MKISKTVAMHIEKGEIPEAIRSQVPTDSLRKAHWQPGQVPVGGFRSTYCFDGSYDMRRSPTSKPGNAK